jgi:DNA-binding transcriptional LysR family regulator
MNGDTIKVTQLYYVRAAADLGSFSGAAAALGVTQPALSHGIAALEHTLGGPLFTRSTTGVSLTPLGARVLPHLNDLLGCLDVLLTVARTRSGADSEPLRLGVSPLIHPALVARAFQAARQHAPAALILKEDNLADLRSALLNRDLDLILVPAVSDAKGLLRRSIDSEPVHYLPSAGHGAGPSADPHGGLPIEIAELSGRALVMVGEACGLTTFTRSLFASTGIALQPYPGEADSYRSLEDWAHLGLGGALLPRSRFHDERGTRPVHDRGEPVVISYEALWPAHSTRVGAIDALLDAILVANASSELMLSPSPGSSKPLT